MINVIVNPKPVVVVVTHTMLTFQKIFPAMLFYRTTAAPNSATILSNADDHPPNGKGLCNCCAPLPSPPTFLSLHESYTSARAAQLFDQGHETRQISILPFMVKMNLCAHLGTRALLWEKTRTADRLNNQTLDQELPDRLQEVWVKLPSGFLQHVETLNT